MVKKTNNYFNIRLYIEGLKKLRVIGIAASIVVIGICAMVPITYIITESGARYSDKPPVYNVEISEFALPLVLILFFAPFFVSSVLSFLNRRNESDFYHSIPYKRECVFNSFMLAAFTWVLGIITASVLLCGTLWLLAPNTSFGFSVIPLLIAAAFAACVILMCFMALSMSLTGTAMSNIFIFGLLTFFLRFALFLLSYTIDSVVPIWQAGDTIGMFIKPSFFFPLAFLGNFIGSINAADVYTNIPLYIYTALASIALYLLSLYMYKRRRSEMAGKSAPSRRLQHIYRIAFTTPFVLLLSGFAAEEAFGFSSIDIEWYVILSVLALSVYYLYELITTRSPKSMLKATPYLFVLVLIAASYIVGVGCVRSVVLSKIPEASDVSYVVFEVKNQSGMDEKTYEELKCQDTKIKDREVIESVCTALEFSINSVKDGTWSRRQETSDNIVYESDVYYGYDYKYDYISYEFTNVTIKLENGQSIKRRIKMTSGDYSAMMTEAKNTDEYGEAYLSIPKPRELYALSYSYMNGIDLDKQLDWKGLYESYYNEYMSLSHDQKIKAKDTDGFYSLISFLGREGLDEFVFSMKISTLTPETLKLFAGQVLESEYEDYDDTIENASVKESVEYVFDKIEAEGEGIFFAYSQYDVSVNAQIYNGNGERIGYVNAQSGAERDSYTKATALMQALGDYGCEYDSDKYIIALNLTLHENLGSKTEHRYISLFAIYFVDAEFVNTLGDNITPYYD